ALVREHRAAHAIADRPDTVHRRAAVIVDLDESARIERHGRLGHPEIARVRSAADGDDEPIDRELVRALRVLVRDLHAFAAGRGPGDLRAEPDIESLALELPQGLARELL